MLFVRKNIFPRIDSYLHASFFVNISCLFVDILCGYYIKLFPIFFVISLAIIDSIPNFSAAISPAFP